VGKCAQGGPGLEALEGLKMKSFMDTLPVELDESRLDDQESVLASS
jgi:hypothetical protein